MHLSNKVFTKLNFKEENMNSKLFDDLPGVGEVILYRENKLLGIENFWIDDLAYKMLELNRPLRLSELNEITCPFGKCAYG
jgi:hypothetical protein